MHTLPINLDDLINARSVESVRREFKKTWSEQTLEQVIRSICAFANDFFNLNGGYIVLGIEEHDGKPVLPPCGLAEHNIDVMQRRIREQCRRIDPEYQPLISPETYQEQPILVLWVPAGDVRPYQAPKTRSSSERAYYVRQGSESVEARGDILTQLMQMTAKVPFDARRSANVAVESLSPALVRNFLADIHSDLVAPGTDITDRDLYRHLRIVVKVNAHEVPIHVALLFFTNDPEQFFPGSRIEIVQFGDDAGGDLIEEKVFRGPLSAQLRHVLDYLQALSTTMIRKIPNQAETYRTVAFPYEAMEEAIGNAVYHRSYEGNAEPTKVYLYPDRMEVISYPGPVPGIERHHFLPGATVPPVPNRNRRIGEFLKELRLAEGRGTGIPKIRRKMHENGSPEPVFEFDDARSYFRVILPAHPQYVVIHALRESAHLWAVGERQQALHNLKAAAKRVPQAGALLAQMIEYRASLGEFSAAESLFAQAEAEPTMLDRHLPYLAMAKVFLDHHNARRATEVLARIPSPTRTEEIIELAILYKRSRQLRDAHNLFSANFDLIKNNAKAVHEYAQTKLQLARSQRDSNTKKRLNREAAELLRRAIQLSDGDIRSAWCWYDLARTLAWLRVPDTEIVQAYGKALELLPTEERFHTSYQTWQQRKK